MGLLVIAVIGVAAWLFWESQAAPASVSSGGTVTASGSKVGALSQAIYQFEGGGKPGATNSWNNNPGNVGGGQNTFTTKADGWQALSDWITGHASANPNWNFYDFFSNYLGTPGNYGTTAQGNATDYANYVAQQVGANPNQSVWGFING